MFKTQNVQNMTARPTIRVVINGEIFAVKRFAILHNLSPPKVPVHISMFGAEPRKTEDHDGAQSKKNI